MSWAYSDGRSYARLNRPHDRAFRGCGPGGFGFFSRNKGVVVHGGPEVLQEAVPELGRPVGWRVQVDPIRIETDEPTDMQYQAFQRYARTPLLLTFEAEAEDPMRVDVGMKKR